MSARLTLLVIVAVLAMPGCSASPTEIAGGAQVFQGTVPFGGSVQHDFSITSAGGVRIEAESIVAEPPLPEGITPSLGFGLGEPTSVGTCDQIFRGNINEVSSLAFGLQARDYCLTLADNGTFPEDSTRTYSIVVRPSE